MKQRAIAIAVIAFLGMVDTLYLASKRSEPVPCRITSGCNDVLTSRYSAVAGIPLPWFGLAFYLTVFSCAIFEMFGTSTLMGKLLWIAAPAFGISLVLTGIQAFVLKAYCEYCLGSAALVTTIFLLSLGPYLRKRTQ